MTVCFVSLLYALPRIPTPSCISATALEASPAATGEELQQDIMQAFSELGEELRHLDALPLAVNSLLGASPAFRYTQVSPQDSLYSLVTICSGTVCIPLVFYLCHGCNIIYVLCMQATHYVYVVSFPAHHSINKMAVEMVSGIFGPIHWLTSPSNSGQSDHHLVVCLSKTTRKSLRHILWGPTSVAIGMHPSPISSRWSAKVAEQ